MPRSHFLAGAALLLIILAKTSAQPHSQVGTSGSRLQGPAGPVAGNVERGRYLAEHVAMCVECHSGRDEQGNIIEAKRYMGAPGTAWSTMGEGLGPQCASQQGPAWIRRCTGDATADPGGNRPDGTQLKMPMPRFRMKPQDAADVIVYLRSLQ